MRNRISDLCGDRMPRFRDSFLARGHSWPALLPRRVQRRLLQQWRDLRRSRSDHRSKSLLFAGFDSVRSELL